MPGLVKLSNCRKPRSLSPSDIPVGIVTCATTSCDAPAGKSITAGATGGGCHRVPKMLKVNLAGADAALVTKNLWLTGEAGRPNFLLLSGAMGAGLSPYLSSAARA